MPVNDFEKQVQQRMDELQLRPSAEVWEEVEKRIRKEKKRRWAILWFFLLGALLLGGISWWLLTGNKQQITSGNTAVQKTTDKKIVDQSATEKNDITNKTTKSEENNNEKKVDNEKIVANQNIVSPIGKTKSDNNTQMPAASKVYGISKRNKKVNNIAVLPVENKNRTTDEIVTTIDKRDNQLRIIPEKNERDVADVEKKNDGVTTDVNIKGNDSVSSG